MRLILTEEEIYQRVMARITELMAGDPELGSRDGIELDHLTAAIELYERIKWPMGVPHAPHARSKSQLRRYATLGAKQFTCAFCGAVRDISALLGKELP